MIDIYNEVGYIKNILQSGLSKKWERDARLMASYLKEYEHLKKPQVKDKIIEYCNAAAEKKIINFSRIRDFGKINSLLDYVWKHKTPLRQIEYIDIPREVIDYFLGLEDIEISKEEGDRLKKLRPGLVLKKSEGGYKAFNFNRVKYLFTLYVWTKIQEQYLEFPNIHYLKKYQARFKEDADLPASFNMEREKNYLYDLGYLKITYSLGIIPAFMENEVFKTEIREDNRVRIYTSEEKDEKISEDHPSFLFPSGELYHPGVFLEKQKFGSFVCEECGKEFAHYSLAPAEKKRKYCKECGAKINHGSLGKRGKAREIERYCVDCGRLITHIVSDNDFKTCRCVECQKKRNNERP